HDPFDIEFDYQVLQRGMRLNLSIVVTTQDEVCAFNVTSYKEKSWDGKLFPVGRYRTSCRIPGDLLNNGRYRVSLLFVRDTSVAVCQLKDVLEFDVGDSPEDRGAWYGKWSGVFRPRLSWETQRFNQ